MPLRLPASRAPDHDSLQSRILKIHSQKGPFRNVTERSLIREINSQKQQDEDLKMADVNQSDTEEPEDRYQTIIKSREDMMQLLRLVSV